MAARIHLADRPLRQPAALVADINKRDSGSDSSSNQSIIIGVVVVIVLLCSSLAAYFVLRCLRARHAKPTYLPTSWLKKKWSAWTPASEKRRSFLALPMDGSAQRSRSASNTDTSNFSGHPDRREGSSGADDNVDRHTSVRSIMTLPAYSADARPTEEIIGREGERAGVDTVVEYPETLEEEDARRDEEMESLYQIRLMRREERASREERRRLRAEARARGDLAALEESRQQDREARRAAAADNNASEALIQEHRSRERGRRVSSVSYMDLGVARHDGSRVRADSGDSDRRPLMDSAAQMGGAGVVSGGRDGSRDAATRARSGSHPFRTHLHSMSTSSLSRFMTPDISDDERSSVDFEIVPTPDGRGSRATSVSHVRPTVSMTRLRLDSIDQDDRSDVHELPAGNGDVDFGPRPPRYDELSPIADANENPQQQQQQQNGTGEDEERNGDLAPAYESPITNDAPRIPSFARLPSIRVTPFTPDVSSSGTFDWPTAPP